MSTITDDELRAWATGIYGAEAATELLIRAGRARQYARRDEYGHAWLDFEAAAADVWPGGALSGGERRLVAVAVSLSGYVPTFAVDDADAGTCWAAFSLGEVLPGLDRANLGLVLAAIAHGGGSHEDHPDPFVFDADGTPSLSPDRHAVLGSLYPWPQGVAVAEQKERPHG